MPNDTAGQAASQLPRLTCPEPRTFYQYTHSFPDRVRLSTRLKAKYPGSVPIIFEPGEHVAPLSWDSAATTVPSPCPPPSPAPVSPPAPGHAEQQDEQLQRPSTGAGSSSSEISATAGLSLSPRAQQKQQRQEQEQRLRDRNWRWRTVALGARTQQRAVALKFVLSGHKTLSETIFTLRDRLGVEPHQSVFLSVGPGEVLAPSSSSLAQLYDRYRDADGFLYVSYTLENTFGG